MYLNILVNDLAGIPRYFHLDHVKIPLSPYQSRLKFLIRLLLTLRNVMIVNKILLYYTSMQSEIDDSRVTDSLKRCIAKLETENDKIRAENIELKARIAKLEDKQTQNELIKNLISVLQNT